MCLTRIKSFQSVLLFLFADFAFFGSFTRINVPSLSKETFHYLSLKFNEYSIKICISYFAEGPKIIFLLKLTQNNIKKITLLYEYKKICNYSASPKPVG